MKGRLHTYTNTVTGEVIFTVAAMNLYGADNLFEQMMGTHPRALPNVSVRIKKTNLPEGCLVGDVRDPARALMAQKPNLVVKHPVRLGSNIHFQTKHEGHELAKGWKLFILNTHQSKKRVFCTSCAYCGIGLTEQNLSKDHIYPRVLGGKVTVVSCRTCNTFKGRLLLSEFRTKVFGEEIDNEFFCEYAMRTGKADYQFTGRNKK